jgi:threonine dehydratase
MRRVWRITRSAWACARVIVMPRFTPGVKIERTRGFGADVVLHGDTLDAARAHATGAGQREG